jgi:hypothetical protein
LILALVVGITSSIFGLGISNVYVASTLIIAGVIVGFLNVTARETKDFLLASVSLVIVLMFGGSVLGTVLLIGAYLQITMAAMLIFIVPATIIVALKAIYVAAND